MSTDRQRLQAAIQRIAKQDPELSALIGASKNKGGQASSSGIGVSDAERDNLCCDGTEGSGANAGTDSRDPSDDGSEGLDSSDPANLDDIGSGSLTGVTDCATGQPICFDGQGFITPPAWESPTSPGDEFDVVADEYWRLKFSTFTEYHRTKGQARESFAEAIGPNTEICSTDLADNGDESGTYSNTGNCDGSFVFTYIFSRKDCSPSPIELINEICAGDHDPQVIWPQDSCTNLSIQGGKVVGSKHDPENDGSYSAPRDEIELCDADGNRILLRGSPTGGWKSIKSLSGDIDPDTGNGYLYRPNGQRVRQITPSEFRDDTV